ncbi:LysR family transcriptional regulator [Enterobacter hormaechei]
MIEIKHLKTLQALRNCGSLAAAAATLHQTQSALSHQFSDLEQRLGFRLLCVEPAFALRRRAKFCFSWRTRCCRRLPARCSPATSRSRPPCASPFSVTAVFSGWPPRLRTSARSGRRWRWTSNPASRLIRSRRFSRVSWIW